MKLPSIDDYNKQVSDAILKTIETDEDSFVKCGVKSINCKVRLNEFGTPSILCAVEVNFNKNLAGFSIQLVFNDMHDNMIEVADTFVSLTESGNSRSKVYYQEIYLPHNIDLREVEKMLLSAEDPVVTPEAVKEGK